MASLRPLPVATAAIVLLLAACGSDATKTLHPEIEVRSEPGPGGPLAEVPFGKVPVGETVTRTVHVHSLQTVALEVERLRVEGADAARFGVSPVGPFVVPAVSSRAVTVRFQPLQVRLHEAVLVIPSNDPDGEVRLPLTGEGVSGTVHLIACLPSTSEEPQRCRDTQVEPPAPLDLGEVIEGRLAVAQLSILNDGEGALTVRAVSFVDPAAASAAGFSFHTEVEGTAVVEPLTSVEVRIALTPTAARLGAVAADVEVQTDDPERPTVTARIQATAVANQGPQACVEVRQIVRRDGTVVDVAPGSAVPPVEPLDTVIVDGLVRDGCSGDPEDGSLVDQEWSVEAPGVSPALDAVAGSPFRRAIVPEVPGLHVVRLAVTDRLGKRAEADAGGHPAEAAFTVVLPRDVGVYVLWPDAPFVDLDLHFVHPDATLWDDRADGPSDCHWANPSPNWGDPGTRSDDPLLAVDDVGSGQLAESVELDDPEPGARYQLHVHFAGDRRPRSSAPVCNDDGDCLGGLVCSGGRCLPAVPATVELWLEGERVDLPALHPELVNPQALRDPCDDWFVGVIEWPAADGEAPRFLPYTGPLGESGLRDGTVCTRPE